MLANHLACSPPFFIHLKEKGKEHFGNSQNMRPTHAAQVIE